MTYNSNASGRRTGSPSESEMMPGMYNYSNSPDVYNYLAQQINYTMTPRPAHGVDPGSILTSYKICWVRLVIASSSRKCFSFAKPLKKIKSPWWFRQKTGNIQGLACNTVVFDWNYCDSSSWDCSNLSRSLASKIERTCLNSCLLCLRTFTKFGASSFDPQRIHSCSYSLVPISIPQYIEQNAVFLKYKSYFTWRDRSIS